MSPLPLNLKRLYKETLEIEPVLIIISPGADPSQELQELANAERSGECYHQVSAFTVLFLHILDPIETDMFCFSKPDKVFPTCPLPDPQNL